MLLPVLSMLGAGVASFGSSPASSLMVGSSDAPFVMLSHVNLKDDMVEAFKMQKDVSLQVQSNEPGLLYQSLSQSEEDPSHFTFVEIFNSSQALNEHLVDPFVGEFSQTSRPMFESRITFEFFGITPEEEAALSPFLAGLDSPQVHRRVFELNQASLLGASKRMMTPDTATQLHQAAPFFMTVHFKVTEEHAGDFADIALDKASKEMDANPGLIYTSLSRQDGEGDLLYTYGELYGSVDAWSEAMEGFEGSKLSETFDISAGVNTSFFGVGTDQKEALREAEPSATFFDMWSGFTQF